MRIFIVIAILFFCGCENIQPRTMDEKIDFHMSVDMANGDFYTREYYEWYYGVEK
jgi:hypothetical protein